MQKLLKELNKFYEWTSMWYCFYDETKEEVIFVDDEGWREPICKNNKEWKEYIKQKIEDKKQWIESYCH